MRLLLINVYQARSLSCILYPIILLVFSDTCHSIHCHSQCCHRVVVLLLLPLVPLFLHGRREWLLSDPTIYEYQQLCHPSLLFRERCRATCLALVAIQNTFVSGISVFVRFSSRRTPGPGTAYYPPPHVRRKNRKFSILSYPLAIRCLKDL